MQDSTRRSVAPRFGVNGPPASGARAELWKSFRFAVTWGSVTAHLSLVETADLKAQQASVAAVAAVAALPALQKPPIQPAQVQSEAKARWEMVVPKMDRVKRTPQALTGRTDYDDTAAPIPAMAGPLNAPPGTFLTRALAVIGLGGRSANVQPLQLNGPASIDPAGERVNEGREILLSKIAKSLRSRAQESAIL